MSISVSLINLRFSFVVLNPICHLSTVIQMFKVVLLTFILFIYVSVKVGSCYFHLIKSAVRLVYQVISVGEIGSQ